MNSSQQHIIRLLRARADRDLYEANDFNSFYVTYTGDEPRYQPLIRSEVQQLVNEGIVRRKFPDYDGCFVLTEKGMQP